MKLFKRSAHQTVINSYEICGNTLVIVIAVLRVSKQSSARTSAAGRHSETLGTSTMGHNGTVMLIL